MYNEDDIIIVDCLGEMCPIPIMKVQNLLSKRQGDEVYMVITDHSCALVSVDDYCKKHGFKCEPTEVLNGVWEIVISKWFD